MRSSSVRELEWRVAFFDALSPAYDSELIAAPVRAVARALPALRSLALHTTHGHALGAALPAVVRACAQLETLEVRCALEEKATALVLPRGAWRALLAHAPRLRRLTLTGLAACVDLALVRHALPQLECLTLAGARAMSDRAYVDVSDDDGSDECDEDSKSDADQGSGAAADAGEARLSDSPVVHAALVELSLADFHQADAVRALIDESSALESLRLVPGSVGNAAMARDLVAAALAKHRLIDIVIPQRALDSALAALLAKCTSLQRFDAVCDVRAEAAPLASAVAPLDTAALAAAVAQWRELRQLVLVFDDAHLEPNGELLRAAGTLPQLELFGVLALTARPSEPVAPASGSVDAQRMRDVAKSAFDALADDSLFGELQTLWLLPMLFDSAPSTVGSLLAAAVARACVVSSDGRLARRVRFFEPECGAVDTMLVEERHCAVDESDSMRRLVLRQVGRMRDPLLAPSPPPSPSAAPPMAARVQKELQSAPTVSMGPRLSNGPSRTIEHVSSDVQLAVAQHIVSGAEPRVDDVSFFVDSVANAEHFDALVALVPALVSQCSKVLVHDVRAGPNAGYRPHSETADSAVRYAALFDDRFLGALIDALASCEAPDESRALYRQKALACTVRITLGEASGEALRRFARLCELVRARGAGEPLARCLVDLGSLPQQNQTPVPIEAAERMQLAMAAVANSQGAVLSTVLRAVLGVELQQENFDDTTTAWLCHALLDADVALEQPAFAITLNAVMDGLPRERVLDGYRRALALVQSKAAGAALRELPLQLVDERDVPLDALHERTALPGGIELRTVSLPPVAPAAGGLASFFVVSARDRGSFALHSTGAPVVVQSATSGDELARVSAADNELLFGFFDDVFLFSAALDGGTGFAIVCRDVAGTERWRTSGALGATLLDDCRKLVAQAKDGSLRVVSTADGSEQRVVAPVRKKCDGAGQLAASNVADDNVVFRTATFKAKTVELLDVGDSEHDVAIRKIAMGRYADMDGHVWQIAPSEQLVIVAIDCSIVVFDRATLDPLCRTTVASMTCMPHFGASTGALAAFDGRRLILSIAGQRRYRAQGRAEGTSERTTLLFDVDASCDDVLRLRHEFVRTEAQQRHSSALLANDAFVVVRSDESAVLGVCNARLDVQPAPTHAVALARNAALQKTIAAMQRDAKTDDVLEALDNEHAAWIAPRLLCNAIAETRVELAESLVVRLAQHLDWQWLDESGVGLQTVLRSRRPLRGVTGKLSRNTLFQIVGA